MSPLFYAVGASGRENLAAGYFNLCGRKGTKNFAYMQEKRRFFRGTKVSRRGQRKKPR